MQTLLLSALIAVTGWAATAAQQVAEQRVPGTIYFDDGSTQDFVDVRYIEAGGDRNVGLKVSLADGVHYVPYTQLRSMEILRYRPGNCYSRSACLFDVEARIRTTTGLGGVARYGLIGGLEVVVIDPSTGKETELSRRFAEVVDSKPVLSIRKIEFDTQ
jgi:hypothetical protein